MSYEQLLLDMVYLGDVERLRRSMALVEGLPRHTLPHVDSRRRQDVIVISAVALLTRTVIMAGVSEAQAYRYGNGIIEQWDNATEPMPFRNRMLEMLLGFASLVRDSSRRNVSPATRRALDFIERNIYRRLTLPMVASAAGVTPEHLATLFKRETGCTVMGYVNREKILQAKAHLLSDRTSVADVAELLSFSSAAHFIKVFKRITGTTPAAWRRGEQPPSRQMMRQAPESTA